MDLSGRVGPRRVTILGLDFEWCAIVELTVQSLVVEPTDPRARSDLEVVDSLPVTAIGGQDHGVAVQLGLVEGVDRFRHGVIKTIRHGPDRGRGADLGETIGVAERRVLSGFNRWKQHLLVGPTDRTRSGGTRWRATARPILPAVHPL